ncbi:endonuclease III [candidate division KSB1 bacterium]|nr:endonuclease III [candidate division KSB1 bacterium]
MTTETLDTVLTILQRESKHWDVPIVTLIAERSNDPYQVLVSTLLSLRTKDVTTTVASRRLFARATTPEQMLDLSAKEIEKRIFPVGFYHRKAENLRTVSRLILEKHGGLVPDNLDELLALPGVGRKTANLVITLGFGKPGICVDTHVHRISNRFGYVQTKSPDETEMVLREKLPNKWWIPINDILVAFGQSLCAPISPWCSKCKVSDYCEQIGVKTRR